MSERSSDHSLRDPVSHVLTVLGIIALAAGAALGQVRRGLFESDAFADRLASSLSDPRVSAYVAEQITDEVIRKKPDLVAVRPVIVATSRGVVSSDAFRSIVRTAARSAHATAFSQGGRNLLLSVPDVDVILRGALANASPDLAARIPDRLLTEIASLGESPATRFILDLWQSGRHLAWTARALALGGVALVVLGIVLARRRAETLRHAALDMALAGLFLALVLPAARAAVRSLPAEPIAQQAAAGLFDAFALGLRHLALGFGGVGLVFAAAAQSLVGRAWLPETVERLGGWLRRPPESAWGRLLRGAFLLGGGILMILRPSAAVAVLGLVAGAVVAFLGLQELFRLAVREVSEEERSLGGPFGRREKKRAAVVLGMALVLAAGVAWLGRPPEIGIARVSTGCNGDERLCDRTLDAIALPGAHNAMSSVDAPNWMFPQQERSVTGQLEDGVRAFLIDVHAGLPVSGRIRTDVSGDPAMLAKMQKAVGEDGVAAADRIRSRLTGPPEGPRGLYLCHGFCELGALPFVPWLARGAGVPGREPGGGGAGRDRGLRAARGDGSRLHGERPRRPRLPRGAAAAVADAAPARRVAAARGRLPGVRYAGRGMDAPRRSRRSRRRPTRSTSRPSSPASPTAGAPAARSSRSTTGSRRRRCRSRRTRPS